MSEQMFGSEHGPVTGHGLVVSESLLKAGYDEGGMDILVDLITTNSLDKRGDGNEIIPSPSRFVRAAIGAIDRQIKDGHHASAYLIATKFLSSFIYHRSNQPPVSNAEIHAWIHNSMPHLLFPAFNNAWIHKLNRAKIDTLAHPAMVGHTCAQLITAMLALGAVDGWQYKAADNRQAEQITWVRENMHFAIVRSEAALGVQLREAYLRFPGEGHDEQTRQLIWNGIPSLGEYILAKLRRRC